MAGLFLKPRSEDAAHPYCAAVVPAAGTASRMKGIDKILAELKGVPILIRTLTALHECPLIDEIVVVTREDLILSIGKLAGEYGLTKVKQVIRGGSDRAESVSLGLREISDRAELVAIHDGARPFVSQELLEEVITCAAKTRAAAPAIPVIDTIKVAKDGIIQSTPDRSTLYAVQTPQVFDKALIVDALTKVRELNIPLTDDCSAVEAMGLPVTLTAGSRENMKITTPIDMAIGEMILCRQQH